MAINNLPRVTLESMDVQGEYVKYQLADKLLLLTKNSYRLYNEGVILTADIEYLNHCWLCTPLDMEKPRLSIGDITISSMEGTRTDPLEIENPKLAMTVTDDEQPNTGTVTHTDYDPCVFHGIAYQPVSGKYDGTTIVHPQRSADGVEVTADGLTSFTIDVTTDSAEDRYVYLPYSLPWTSVQTLLGLGSPNTDLPAGAELFIFKIGSSARESSEFGEVFCPEAVSTFLSTKTMNIPYTLASQYPQNTETAEATLEEMLASPVTSNCAPIINYMIWVRDTSFPWLAFTTGFLSIQYVYGSYLHCTNDKVYIRNNSADRPVILQRREIKPENPYIQDAWDLHKLPDFLPLYSALNGTPLLDVTNIWIPITGQLTKYWANYSGDKQYHITYASNNNRYSENTWSSIYPTSLNGYPSLLGTLYPIFYSSNDNCSKAFPNIVNYPNSLTSTHVITDFIFPSYIKCDYYIQKEDLELPSNYSPAYSGEKVIDFPVWPIHYPYRGYADIIPDIQTQNVTSVHTNTFAFTPYYIPFFEGSLRCTEYTYTTVVSGKVTEVHTHKYSTYYSLRHISTFNFKWGIGDAQHPNIAYNNNITTAVLVKIPKNTPINTYTFTIFSKFLKQYEGITTAYTLEQKNEDKAIDDNIKKQSYSTFVVPTPYKLNNPGFYNITLTIREYLTTYKKENFAPSTSYPQHSTYIDAVPTFLEGTKKYQTLIQKLLVNIMIDSIPVVAYPSAIETINYLLTATPINPDPDLAQEIKDSMMISAPFMSMYSDDPVIALIPSNTARNIFFITCDIQDNKIIEYKSVCKKIALNYSFIPPIHEILGICHTIDYDKNHNTLHTLLINCLVINEYGEKIHGVASLRSPDFIADGNLDSFYFTPYVNNNEIIPIPDDMRMPKGIACIYPYIFVLGYMRNMENEKDQGYTMCIHKLDITAGSPVHPHKMIDYATMFTTRVVPPVSANYIKIYSRETNTQSYPVYLGEINEPDTSIDNTTYPINTDTLLDSYKNVPTLTGLSSYGSELVAYHNGLKRLCKINPITCAVEKHGFSLFPFISTWESAFTEYNQTLLVPFVSGDSYMIGQYPEVLLAVEDLQFPDEASTCIDVQNIAPNVPTIRNLALRNTLIRDRLENIVLDVPTTLPEGLEITLSLSEEGPWTTTLDFGDIGINPSETSPFFMRVLADRVFEEAYAVGLDATISRKTVFYA